MGERARTWTNVDKLGLVHEGGDKEIVGQFRKTQGNITNTKLGV